MLCSGYTKKGLPCTKKSSLKNSYCNIHCKTYKFEKPEECPICMENLQDEKRPLECGHWVHKECLLKWNDICPTCRAPVSLTRNEKKSLNNNTKKHENNNNPIIIEISIENGDEGVHASGGSIDIEELDFNEWLTSLIEIFNRDD